MLFRSRAGLLEQLQRLVLVGVRLLQRLHYFNGMFTGVIGGNCRFALVMGRLLTMLLRVRNRLRQIRSGRHRGLLRAVG